MKNKFKVIISTTILTLIIVSILYTANKPIEVNTVIASYGDGKITFKESGYVDYNVTEVYPLANGEVEKVYVKENDQINEGDILATLKNDDIQYQINILESNIKSLDSQKENIFIENSVKKDNLKTQKDALQAQLTALDAQKNEGTLSTENLIKTQELIIEQNSKNLENAKTDLKNNEVLYTEGIISKDEYNEYNLAVDSLESTYKESILQLENLEENVETNKLEYFNGSKSSIIAQIDGIDVALKKDTTGESVNYYNALIEQSNVEISKLKDNINNLNIISPITGTVSDVHLDNSNIGNINQSAFSIWNKGGNVINTSVNTRDIEYMSVGNNVNIIFNTRDGEREFTGEIIEVSNIATKEVSSLGINENKVNVKISYEDNEALKPGYGVDVEFIISEEKDKIIIPSSAVYEKENIKKVLIIKDGKISECNIETGTLLDGKVIVESGLKVNDEVIVDLDNENISVGKKAIGN
ncbi:MAG: HlyD family secretion protein [Lachnospirales bacterium]